MLRITIDCPVCGAQSRHEIALPHDVERAELHKRIASHYGQGLSCRAVAELCDTNKDTVSRVWRSIQSHSDDTLLS